MDSFKNLILKALLRCLSLHSLHRAQSEVRDLCATFNLINLGINRNQNHRELGEQSLLMFTPKPLLVPASGFHYQSQRWHTLQSILRPDNSSVNNSGK